MRVLVAGERFFRGSRRIRSQEKVRVLVAGERFFNAAAGSGRRSEGGGEPGLSGWAPERVVEERGSFLPLRPAAVSEEGVPDDWGSCRT